MAERICVVIEDDVYEKIRVHQANLIKINLKSCSFSCTLNDLLKRYFGKNA